MRNLLFLAMLLLVLGVEAKTKVALVFDNKQLCPTGLCLHGKFPKGVTVSLLSFMEDKACVVKTGKSFKVEFEPGPFDATRVEGLKKCKGDHSKLFLAVFGKLKAKYQILPLEQPQEEEFSAADQKLKKDIVFTRAWKRDVYYPQGNKDRVPYTTSDYKGFKSVGFAFAVSKKEKLLLLRQKVLDGANEGILFSLYKGKWSTVSSTFTVHDPFVFTLDKRLYVYSRVSCQMPCGYIDHEIYEYNGRNFKLIYNNADFST